jgi:hypothetical protein
MNMYDFMAKLGGSIDLECAYAEDPDAVMAQSDLSQGDKDLVRSDETAICRAMRPKEEFALNKLVLAPTSLQADGARKRAA